MALTAKQQAFINHYLTTWNATEAARRAQYKGDDATLAAVGYENLRKPHIRSAIDERMRELTIDANEVLLRMARMATGDMSDFLSFDNAGARLDLGKAEARGKLGLIKKFSSVENVMLGKDDSETVLNRRITIELYPADGALDKLARHYGLYNDRLEVTWKTEIIQLIKDGRLTQEEVAEEMGADLASELFAAAGVPIVQGRETQAHSSKQKE
jgi:phage terminase small subunit